MAQRNKKFFWAILVVQWVGHLSKPTSISSMPDGPSKPCQEWSLNRKPRVSPEYWKVWHKNLKEKKFSTTPLEWSRIPKPPALSLSGPHPSHRQKVFPPHPPTTLIPPCLSASLAEGQILASGYLPVVVWNLFPPLQGRSVSLALEKVSESEALQLLIQKTVDCAS